MALENRPSRDRLVLCVCIFLVVLTVVITFPGDRVQSAFNVPTGFTDS